MNHEHRIGSMWRASLQYFTCEQLGIFAKLTLNAYFITLQLLLKYFGWIFALWLGLIYWPAFVGIAHRFFTSIEPEMARIMCASTMNLVLPLIVFFNVCAARSSITLKNLYYFVSKTARFFIPFLLLSLLIIITLNMLLCLLHIPLWFQIIVSVHLSLYTILFCFFYLDTYSIIKALTYAFKMFLYTYPIMIVMGLVSVVLHYLCSLPIMFFSVVLSNTALLYWLSALIFWLFGSTLLVVMMSNIYMKHVYEYNKIYCPVP